MEREWPKLAGPEHIALGVLPAYLISSTGDAMLCYAMLCKKPSDEQTQYPERMQVAKVSAKYDRDARFVLARTNHHVQLPTKKSRMPLSARRLKGKKTLEHKHLFPKRTVDKATVVCKGLAKALAYLFAAEEAHSARYWADAVAPGCAGQVGRWQYSRGATPTRARTIAHLFYA